MIAHGGLGATEGQVLHLAFDVDRILVTANIVDLRRLARRASYTRGHRASRSDEQLVAVRAAVAAIKAEFAAGRDMVNGVLLLGPGGKMTFENIPPAAGAGT